MKKNNEKNREQFNIVPYKRKRDYKMTTHEVIKNLETLFEKLNEKFFNGALLMPYITLFVGAKKNGDDIRGAFYSDKYINVNNDADFKYEIGIAGERLGDGIFQVAETLMHEMVHMFCEMNGYADTKGRSHTKIFKREAEKRGLICEKAKGIGFGHTEATPQFCDFIQNLVDNGAINPDICTYARYTTFPETKSTQRKAFICPVCSAKVTAKPDTAIACMNCNTAFDLWDISDKEDPKILVDHNNGLAMTAEGWYGQMFGTDELLED